MFAVGAPGVSFYSHLAQTKLNEYDKVHNAGGCEGKEECETEWEEILGCNIQILQMKNLKGEIVGQIMEFRSFERSIELFQHLGGQVCLQMD